VVFQEEDAMASGLLSCALNADCSDVNKEALVLDTGVSVKSISQQRATDMMKVNDGICFNQWGATKHKNPIWIENGEKMFVLYNQSMLIAVFDSARVFDPGGYTMNKEYQSFICIPSEMFMYCSNQSEFDAAKTGP
jgi:hypothetical protein